MKKILTSIAILIVLATAFTASLYKSSKDKNLIASGPHPAKLAFEKYLEKTREVDKKYDKYTPSEGPPGADLSYWKSIEQYTKKYEQEEKEAALYYKDLLKPFQDELISEYANKDNDKLVRATITFKKFLGIDELRSLLKENNIKLRTFYASMLIKYSEEYIEKRVNEYAKEATHSWDLPVSLKEKGLRNGDYGTGWQNTGIFSGFKSDGSLTEEYLNNVESEILLPFMPKVEKVFKGVNTIEGFVPIKNLNDVITHKDIFLVDVTADEYFGGNQKDKFMPGIGLDGIIPREEIYNPATKKNHK